MIPSRLRALASGMGSGGVRARLLGLAAFGGLGLGSLSLLATPNELPVVACFDDAGGLESGDAVMIGGVEVGRVTDVRLDSDFRACAQLAVDAELPLADDTSASIHTRNVLGDKYVALQPGGSERRLAAGDHIHYTQGALVVERMVGRLLMRLDAGD